MLEKTGQPMLVVRASGRLRERIPDAVYQTMKEDGVLIEVEARTSTCPRSAARIQWR